MKSDLWVEEKCGDYAARFRVTEVLFSGQSDFQAVDVVQTAGHGKMLLNDGLVMLTERDEFVYHDMIVHVPLFVHPNPKSVLIIGGGDGGTAREVLRHAGVERVVMVEIDKMVVNACIEHIPQTARDLSNERLELIIDDGVVFVENTNEMFDVVLVDSTDPIGPAQPLFGPEFYQNIHRVLNANGIVVSQGESPWYHAEMQAKLVEIVAGTFDKTFIYNFSNMGYPGGLWSFTFATKGLHPIADFDSKRVTDSGLEFEYYNIDLHKGCFAIPSFQRKPLEAWLSKL